MKKFIIPILFVFMGLGSLTAQTFVGSPNRFRIGASSKVFSSDTLKILAVMVEFQEDKYDATIGNGKFGSMYTVAYGDTILDPLPHDASYFGDHLTFAQNYFRKVSGGKLNIAYYVLPQVVTVSKTMRYYVPPYHSDDLSLVADLSKEVWETAGNQFPNFNFGNYDLFVIFHAGVSNGLNDGSVSINRNMPSVYLSYNSLKNIYGSAFNGFDVENGRYKVTNSIVLPETESREYEAVDGSKVLLQLTINGAIVANIASHLGLPDLYNTKTGLSVIGRFGLMDGQAIIANLGLFPPEPSAWEKMYLGWESPTTVAPGDYKLDLSTRATAQAGDTTVLKVPINSSEYYLLENREQDAKKDGVILTYKVDGQILQKTVYPDSLGILPIEDGTIHGVLLDVDEYDAAVPGNGIVIWHIDDNVINSKIGTDEINNDDNNRGVDVEEADGIQDIGIQFTSVFGDFIGEGTNEDLWYSSNPAKLYTNKFGYDTKPQAVTNTGANSLITFSNFSDYSNKMSFNLSFGGGNLSILSVKKFDDGDTVKSITYPTLHSGYIYIQRGSNLFKIDHVGSVLAGLNSFTVFKPAVYSYGTSEVVFGAIDKTINGFFQINDQIFMPHYDLPEIVTCAPVVRIDGLQPYLLVGTADGKVTSYSLSAAVEGSFTGSVDIQLDEAVKQIAVDQGYVCAVGQKTFADNNGQKLSFTNDIKQIILTKDQAGNYLTVLLQEGNDFSIVQNGQVIGQFKVNAEKEITSFALADLMNNGENYIIFNSGKDLNAVNLKGAGAENFPFETTDKVDFTGTPLALDLDYDGISDLITFTTDGRIFAVSGKTGKTISPFPITNGSMITAQPVIFSSPANGTLIFALSDADNLYQWQLNSTSSAKYWTAQFGDQLNSSFVSGALSTNKSDTYFPLDKAYNWPNPVYGSETNIRYYVSEDSKVNIKIFDLAGDKVDELNDYAQGGYDHETVWKVNNIQSGVYLARINVTSSTGKSQNKIIKIAVIK